MNICVVCLRVTLSNLYIYPCSETVLWKDRLQQGHVQQVDPSGQSTRRRPEDIQSRTYSFISTCYHDPTLFGSPWFKYNVRVCLCVWLCFAPQVENIEDQVREKLLQVQKGNFSQLEEKEKNELKKRKLLSEV